MHSTNIIPVIMAGGSGTRLWPLSRTKYPKQFLTLGLDEHTLLQKTVLRLKELNCAEPILICNEEHRFLVAEQVRKIGVHPTIILEPVGKNTAPATALVAYHLKKNDDAVMLVLPADHVINDEKAFTESIINAHELALQDNMVTFGITPTHPETGYGYIKQGKALLHGHHIDTFVEKPDYATAQNYLKSGDFLWNSGMFMFKASQYLKELATHAPDIADVCQKAMLNTQKDLDFVRIDKAIFESCRSDSIDYAVMENTDNAVVVALSAGWSDVGSWSALWDIQTKDQENNILIGDVITHNSHNNYAHSENRLITLVGVENLVVVETKDAILVANKDHTQDIKHIVQNIKNNDRYEHDIHREAYRPWGHYDSLAKDAGYQVKHIVVNPGQKLSLQMHHHRSEHWIVVNGTAKIHKADKSFLLAKNESVYIPLGETHSLENPGKIPLEIIEVQSGDYLGEDDIVRFDDIYGRTDNGNS